MTTEAGEAARPPRPLTPGDAADRGLPRGASVWLGLLLSCAGLILLIYGCAGTSSIRHGDSLDVSRYPQDMQDAYKVFAVRCSRCHTLARPLNARIRDQQHWVRYVERMRLNPSSGINAKNGQIILRFLLYYMQQRQAEERNQDEATEAPSPESPSELAPAQPEKASALQPASQGAGARQETPDAVGAPADSVSEPAAPEMNP